MTKDEAIELVTQALALGLTAPNEDLIRSCSGMAARIANDAKLSRKDMEKCKANAIAKVDALIEERDNRVIH